MKGMKEANWSNTKIGVGSVVTERVREMEENTKEGRLRSTRKEVVGYVHDVVGKKKLLF